MLVDTGVLLEVFNRPPSDAVFLRIQEAVADEPIFCSVIQLGEVADACRREGKDVAEHMAKVRSTAEIVPIDEAMAVAASDLKAEARRRPPSRDFGLLDGIVLAAARSRGQRLLTFDPDFAGFPDAIVLRR